MDKISSGDTTTKIINFIGFGGAAMAALVLVERLTGKTGRSNLAKPKRKGR